jgi:hypothetical protein
MKDTNFTGSNRTYACIVCGVLRRLPKPIPPSRSLSQAEAELRLPQMPPVALERFKPIPYGHWRSIDQIYPPDFQIPSWLMHCGKPLFILGKRAAQAATTITAEERIQWLALGARIIQGQGKKRWKPILSELKLRDGYPLP